jgi:hypothetical protein
MVASIAVYILVSEERERLAFEVIDRVVIEPRNDCPAAPVEGIHASSSSLVTNAPCSGAMRRGSPAFQVLGGSSRPVRLR